MNKLNIKSLHFSNIDTLPSGWDNNKYLQLLEKLNYQNPAKIPVHELEDMCLMAITDFEPAEAATILLSFLADDKLTEGQIENLAHEMQTEKLWEEYADLSLHPVFFNATQLLRKAYNGKFPQTEAVKFQVEVMGNNLSQYHFDQAFIIRLLAQGMPENTLLKRLYHEALEGGEFDDSVNILWQFSVENQSENSLIISVVSSSYWFKDFKFVEVFEVAAIENTEE